MQQARCSLLCAEFNEVESNIQNIEELQADLKDLNYLKEELARIRKKYNKVIEVSRQALNEKDLEKALQDANTALSICSDSEDAKELCKIIEKDQKKTRSHLNRAKLACESAEFDRAIKEIDAAMDLWSKLKTIDDRMAQLKKDSASYELAISAVRQALDRGDVVEADEACERAEKVCPRAKEVKQLKKTICEKKAKNLRILEDRQRYTQMKKQKIRRLFTTIGKAVENKNWKLVLSVLLFSAFVGIVFFNDVLEDFFSPRSDDSKLMYFEADAYALAERISRAVGKGNWSDLANYISRKGMLIGKRGMKITYDEAIKIMSKPNEPDTTAGPGDTVLAGLYRYSDIDEIMDDFIKIHKKRHLAFGVNRELVEGIERDFNGQRSEFRKFLEEKVVKALGLKKDDLLGFGIKYDSGTPNKKDFFGFKLAREESDYKIVAFFVGW